MKSHEVHDHDDAPQCRCGQGKMVVRCSGKFANNPGRHYYKCPYNGKHAQSFIWCDEFGTRVQTIKDEGFLHQPPSPDRVEDDLMGFTPDWARRTGLGGRNLPRAAAMKRKSGSKHAAAASKRTKQPRTAAIPVEDEVSSEEDDEMGDESGSDYEDDEEGGGGSAAGAFQVDDGKSPDISIYIGLEGPGRLVCCNIQPELGKRTRAVRGTDTTSEATSPSVICAPYYNTLRMLEWKSNVLIVCTGLLLVMVGILIGKIVLN
ncbi:hypothetical protein SASPL_152705 [Salvia splendens]|uniref:GRF-type domain-containing protein n=1 Tax=Salvia splendens TaxID=180675 RepID=A0A8X8W3V2_SALSN|nr:hypothetical protein SASPL_152705 [Salvia splendens]